MMKQNCIIKMLVMDVDGTLTDGKIYMGQDGEILKAFNVKDGYAINEILPKHGITPIIITSRISKIVENRANEIGIKFVHQGVKDKLPLIKKIADENFVTLEEIAYIGDDLNDMDCIKVCGFTGCPSDAVTEIKNTVNFISSKNGGNGAVREFVEIIINRQIPKKGD